MLPRDPLHSGAANITGPSDGSREDRPWAPPSPSSTTRDNLFVLGETLRPLLTNAMGSSVEIFDTSGPAEAGPPPHLHPWEEVYVVISGELEVIVEGESQVLEAGRRGPRAGRA